jgi:hypothetical protein
METLDWTVGAATALTLVQDPRTIAQLSTLLGELSNVAYILLLIAIFCQESDSLKGDIPMSRRLNLMTKAAVIALGLVVVGTVVVLILTPYIFSVMRNDALQLGRNPPAFGEYLVLRIRTVSERACFFAAPYIVYRSQKDRVGTPIDAQPGSELLETGG